MILDAFHFPLPDDADAEAAAQAVAAAAGEELRAAAEAGEEDAVAAAEAGVAAAKKAAAAKEAGAAEAAESDEEAGEEGALAEAAALEAAAAVPAGEVYRMLARRVVPELQRIMVDKDTVRAPVALAGEPDDRAAHDEIVVPASSAGTKLERGPRDLSLGCVGRRAHSPPSRGRQSHRAARRVAPAVVKVLQLLPPAAMRFQLPRTLQKVANLLKARMQSTR